MRARLADTCFAYARLAHAGLAHAGLAHAGLAHTGLAHTGLFKGRPVDHAPAPPTGVTRRVIAPGAIRALCANRWALVLIVLLTAPIALSSALAQPRNDACAHATPLIASIPTVGDATGATTDGSSLCSLASGDVYHTFTTSVAGVYTFSLCDGTTWDTTLSLHSACPATSANQIAGACDDDGCRQSGQPFGTPSFLQLALRANTTYIVRVAGYNSQSLLGPYLLTVTAPDPVLGACCVATACSITSASACLAMSGQYQGDLANCLAPANTPLIYPGTGTPAPIPDATPTGISRTITIPSTGSDARTVGDVALTLNLAHPFLGDLFITLEHLGQTATIINKVGAGAFGASVNLTGVYTFTDSAALSFCDDPAILFGTTSYIVPSGSYRACHRSGNTVSLRSTFNGMPSSGAWTLTIVDREGGQVGTFNSWSLTIDGTSGPACAPPPPPTGACCLGTPRGGVGAQCSILSASDCMVAKGAYQGDAASCGSDASNLIACCRANFNTIGGVNVQDIFDFLGAWFARLPSADFNTIPPIDVQDIFDFLAAWFAGCS